MEQQQEETQAYSESNILYFVPLYEPVVVESPPQELVAFRNKNKYEKMRDGKEFFRQDFIEGYLNDKWNAELNNRDGFKKLYDLYQEYEKFRPQIAKKLSEFKQVMARTDNPYRSLYLDLSKFPFMEKRIETEVDWEN